MDSGFWNLESGKLNLDPKRPDDTFFEAANE